MKLTQTNSKRIQTNSNELKRTQTNSNELSPNRFESKTSPKYVQNESKKTQLKSTQKPPKMPLNPKQNECRTNPQKLRGTSAALRAPKLSDEASKKAWVPGTTNTPNSLQFLAQTSWQWKAPPTHAALRERAREREIDRDWRKRERERERVERV